MAFYGNQIGSMMRPRMGGAGPSASPQPMMRERGSMSGMPYQDAMQMSGYWPQAGRGLFGGLVRPQQPQMGQPPAQAAPASAPVTPVPAQPVQGGGMGVPQMSRQQQMARYANPAYRNAMVNALRSRRGY